MPSPVTSKLNSISLLSAQERLKLSGEHFAELSRRFLAFDRMLERLSVSSCEDSLGVPVSSLPVSVSEGL